MDYELSQRIPEKAVQELDVVLRKIPRGWDQGKRLRQDWRFKPSLGNIAAQPDPGSKTVKAGDPGERQGPGFSPSPKPLPSPQKEQKE